MAATDLQSLCELGQRQLIDMRYLDCQRTLVEAERLAREREDFDTLARLYMPLQECRRQRRQRAGEGVVRLDFLAAAPSDELDAQRIARDVPHGQLLLAGWGTLAPAARLREIAARDALYLDVFLAAAFPIAGGGRAVVIAPTDDVRLPAPDPMPIDALLLGLPAHCIILRDAQLPPGPRPGSPQTYGEVMALWERLATPFLAAGDMLMDPIRKIEAYRRAICVDYACELAHQNLAAVARQLDRARRPAAHNVSQLR
jgi:hypothetical protein